MVLTSSIARGRTLRNIAAVTLALVATAGVAAADPDTDGGSGSGDPDVDQGGSAATVPSSPGTTVTPTGVSLGSGSGSGKPVIPLHDEGRELGLFPLIGGDTDHGFGAGAIGAIAYYDGDHPIYRWKLDFSAFYATKGSPLQPSFVDFAIQLTVPQLLNDHLRLEVRPAFTLDSALPYFAEGNEPSVPDKPDTDRDSYKRLHPELRANARWRLSPHWFLLTGAAVKYSKITADETSNIVRDFGPVDPFLLTGHEELRGELGVAYDSRDNEIAPNSGQWHQIKVRGSPHIGDAFPYGYETINATMRYYRTLARKHVVLALRAVGDLITGNPPIYEEARFEDTGAIGGVQGVRGVPAYQLYGRAKAFGNAELRVKVWRFDKWRRHITIGFAGFVDVGRVWTDIHKANTELDGTGLGLHYGVGTGVRIQQGRSFLIRADIAWSPDARPIGAYLMADQAF